MFGILTIYMAPEIGSKSPHSRAYHLGQRQRTVDATRANIISAARDLIMSDRALAGFSVDAVAKQAKVARATVYNQFGNKRGLLEALFDNLARRGGMFELGNVFQQDHPLDALNLFVAAFARFWTSDRVLIRRLHAMITLDPEMAEADAARQDRRRTGVRIIVGRLSDRYPLAPAMPLQDVIELVHTLTGFEAFDALAGPTRSPDEAVPTVRKLILDVLGLNDVNISGTETKVCG